MKQNEIEFPLQQNYKLATLSVSPRSVKNNVFETAGRKCTELFGRRIILKELKFIYILFFVFVIS